MHRGEDDMWLVGLSVYLRQGLHLVVMEVMILILILLFACTVMLFGYVGILYNPTSL